MIRRPLKINGKPIDSMELFRDIIRKNQTVDMIELSEQWDALLTLFEKEAYLGEKEKNYYFQYVMKTAKERAEVSDTGIPSQDVPVSVTKALTQDIMDAFPEYKPVSEEDFAGTVSRIRKYMHNMKSQLPGDWGNGDDGTGQAVPDSYIEKEACICAENIQVVFDRINESNIRAELKQWMFYITAAFYCRIGIPFEECPADMEKYALYAGTKDVKLKAELLMQNQLKNNSGWIPFIPLERGHAYPVLTAGWEELPADGGLRLCTLYNGMDRDKGTVELSIQTEYGNQRRETGRIFLDSREYLHAVITNTGKLLYVLPSISVNNGQCVLRPGNGEQSLLLVGQNGECLKTWSGRKYEGITGFAADGSGGFLAVRNGYIECEYVEDDALYRNSRLRWAVGRKTEVLDVWIEHGFFYFLKKDGHIFTNSEEKHVDMSVKRKTVPEQTAKLSQSKYICLSHNAAGYLIRDDGPQQKSL